MDFLQPTTWAEALALRAERPDALPIAGGTDVMVELNFDRRRPGALLDLTRVAELREWSATDDGRVRLGAGVPYAPGDRRARRRSCPGWPWPRAPSARRRSAIRGTVGGNLGSASPAGDAHPPLLAADADGRGRVGGPRHPADPGRGVLHRRQAQRPRPPTS